MNDAPGSRRQARTLKDQLPYPYNQDLSVLSGLLIGAAVAWRVALAWAHAEVGRVRARMQDQIDHWQDQAERARASAAYVAERTAAWVAGCRQGREDVLSLARALAQHGPEAGEGSADG